MVSGHVCFRVAYQTESFRLKRISKDREVFMGSPRTAFPHFPFPRLKPYPFPCSNRPNLLLPVAQRQKIRWETRS